MGGNFPRTIQTDRAFSSFRIKLRSHFFYFHMIFLYMYHKMKHISIRACDKSKLMLNIFCFQPYTCSLHTGVDMMVKDQGLSWLVPGSFHWVSNPTPVDHNLFLPLIVYKLLDYHNKQLSELVATSQSITFGCHKQLYLNSFKVA